MVIGWPHALPDEFRHQTHLDLAAARQDRRQLRTPDLEVTQLLDGFNCFNRPCFSPSGDKLYVTGRITGVIEAFDYDPAESPDKGKVSIEGCNPDGATVDEEGYIWSAQWSRQCVVRISPEGEVDTQVAIPGQIVSSVMFGGPDLDLIYVTTIGAEVIGEVPMAESAGMTLVAEGTGFRGRPEPMFKG